MTEYRMDLSDTEMEVRSPPGEYSITTQIAFQHAMAERARERGCGAVGVLRSSRDAVTLGLHQRSEELDWDAVDRWDIEVGRRHSIGGGHFHHEGQLAYAIEIPDSELVQAHEKELDVIDLTQGFMEPIVTALDRMGIDAEFPTESREPLDSDSACLAGVVNDYSNIVVDGRVIVSNALHMEYEGVVSALGAIEYSLRPDRLQTLFGIDATEAEIRERLTDVSEHSDVDRDDALEILEDTLREWAGASDVEWSDAELERVQELDEQTYSTDSWIEQTQEQTADFTRLKTHF